MQTRETQLINEIEHLKARISALEQKQEPKISEIWTLKQIAKYAGYSYGYVKDSLIKRDDFPKCVEHHKRRYLAKDVINYFRVKTN